ncbi:hypothetical protein ACQKOH_14390 [Sphingomonas sp. NPDC092331]|jgi:hypothetical protein|uniref:hypothetical protein n=1 Tax=Sphingomonadaceae TaxID=41297 RepID=UPI000786DED2|nr:MULTISPECIES: hypothetical protein [Sphingomonadaceae]MDH4744902.1 hypothetical protein [Sphingomonas sp. CBMAI 2297]WQD95609.1 hypothetical protein U0041_21865 [Novosphingobium capsulatum]
MAARPDSGTHRRIVGFTRREWQSTLYFLLHGLGFLASTLLITWGLFCLFFLAIGGFSFDGFVHQLNNFTTRYVAADPARTGAFLNMFAIAHMILSTAVIAFRADRILPPRDEEGASRHG